MRSFALLVLASSAFALPLIPSLADVGAVVKAPVKIKAAKVDANNVNVANGALSYNSLNARGHTDALSVVDALVKAPVDAKAANVGLNNVDVAKYAASGNSINLRGTTYTYTDTVPSVLSTAQADIDNIISTVKALLSSTTNPTLATLNATFIDLDDLLASAVKELESLTGLGHDVILIKDDVEVTLEEVAQLVAELIQDVVDLLEEIKYLVGYEVPEIYASLGSNIECILKTVISLLPDIASLLSNVVGGVLKSLSDCGISVDSYSAGM